MNRVLVTSALLFASVAMGCGGGDCPSASNVEEVNVVAGSYRADGDLDVYPTFWSFESSTERALVVDREAGTAVLTYINGDGDSVEVEYSIESTSSVF